MIEPLGPQILTTFSFSPERSTMHLDVVVLVFLAIGLATSSLLVFFLATRCVPTPGACRWSAEHLFIFFGRGHGRGRERERER